MRKNYEERGKTEENDEIGKIEEKRRRKEGIQRLTTKKRAKATDNK